MAQKMPMLASARPLSRVIRPGAPPGLARIVLMPASLTGKSMKMKYIEGPTTLPSSPIAWDAEVRKKSVT